MKNRLRKELEAMLELHTGDSFTADNVHTLVNGIFAADEGGGFEFVEYDNNAFPYPQTIGSTAPSINGLGPADENMIDTIFIMPNKETGPDATLMIVVDEKDPSTDPKIYQYVYVGVINDLPSDVLTEGSIVNDLSTGGTDKPLSAEQGRTLNSHVNYTTCGSGAADQVKLISDDGFELSTHLRLLVMMTNTNTNSTPKFNVNNTGVKDVWYNGAVASNINTWSAGEVLDVYYDGTNYISTTYGGAQFSTGEKVGDVGIDDEPTAGSDNLVKSGGVQNELALGAVYDVSAKNPTAGPNNDGKWESLSALLSDANLNTLIPTSVRKGGMSIKFVQSPDNKYVQYRLTAQDFTTDVNQWLSEKGWYLKSSNGLDNFIKELYLSGIDTTKTYTVSILYEEAKWYIDVKLINQETTTAVSGWNGTTQNGVVHLTQRNSSGISGYALLGNLVEYSNHTVIGITEIDSTKVGNIDFSPAIKCQIQSAEIAEIKGDVQTLQTNVPLIQSDVVELKTTTQSLETKDYEIIGEREEDVSFSNGDESYSIKSLYYNFVNGGKYKVSVVYPLGVSISTNMSIRGTSSGAIKTFTNTSASHSEEWICNVDTATRLCLSIRVGASQDMTFTLKVECLDLPSIIKHEKDIQNLQTEVQQLDNNVNTKMTSLFEGTNSRIDGYVEKVLYQGGYSTSAKLNPVEISYIVRTPAIYSNVEIELNPGYYIRGFYYIDANNNVLKRDVDKTYLYTKYKTTLVGAKIDGVLCAGVAVTLHHYNDEGDVFPSEDIIKTISCPDNTDEKIGDLNNLLTEEKSNVVGAINELVEKNTHYESIVLAKENLFKTVINEPSDFRFLVFSDPHYFDESRYELYHQIYESGYLDCLIGLGDIQPYIDMPIDDCVLGISKMMGIAGKSKNHLYAVGNHDVGVTLHWEQNAAKKFAWYNSSATEDTVFSTEPTPTVGSYVRLSDGVRWGVVSSVGTDTITITTLVGSDSVTYNRDSTKDIPGVGPINWTHITTRRNQYDFFARHLQDDIHMNPLDPYNVYYYKDFEYAKVRIIVLNACDIFDNDTIEYRYRANCNYQQKQLNWLVDVALDLSSKGTDISDWHIIVCSHTYNVYNIVIDTLIAAHNGTSINQTKTYYTRMLYDAVTEHYIEDTEHTLGGVTLTVNKTFDTPLKIIALRGHDHFDYYQNFDGMKVLEFYCDNEELFHPYVIEVNSLPIGRYYFTTIRSRRYEFEVTESYSDVATVCYNAYFAQSDYCEVSIMDSNGCVLQKWNAQALASADLTDYTELTGFENAIRNEADKHFFSVVSLNKATNKIKTTPFSFGANREISI